MGEFHFLRPWWLLALPIGVALIVRVMRTRGGVGGWRRVVDASLQPFVLSETGLGGHQRWPLIVALAALIISTFALAGPTWKRIPVPAFRSSEALVVALDLSLSMDAGDLKPSRLARARFKLRALLDRRQGGQTGLVVFSADAFTVTPLTTDTHTISALIPALTTDLMPSQGTNLVKGLQKAASLLRQAHVPRGKILLMTDAPVSADALRQARTLADEDFTVDVLGIGTAQGAPIPRPGGGFVQDRDGQVVVPKLDAAALGQLAKAGGGRFAVMTVDDRDLDTLFPSQAPGTLEQTGTKDDQRKVDEWSDAGRWLVLLLLPLLAFGFRRGWLCVLLVGMVISVPPVHAQATNSPDQSPRAANDGSAHAALSDDFSWKDAWKSLWKRPDQRGAAALQASQPDRAARLFEDPAWRAAAQYRAGDYAASAASLSDLDTAKADYNRGNALARAGQLQAAINAYDKALQLDPDNEDARYNRDLVRKLLDQQKSAQKSGDKGDKGDKRKDGDSGQRGRNAGSSQQDKSNDSNASGGTRDSQKSQGSQGSKSKSDSSQDQSQASGSSSNPDQTGDERSDSNARDQTEREDEAKSAKTSGKQGGQGGQGDQGDEQDKSKQDDTKAASSAPSADSIKQWASEQAAEQWLRRIPQDPGGLLRRKFLYQYQRSGINQEGKPISQGDEGHEW